MDPLQRVRQPANLFDRIERDPPKGAAGIECNPSPAIARQTAIYIAGRENPTPRLRTGTPKDLRFLNDLQRKFGHSVGFLVSDALLSNLETENVQIALENGEPAGYLLGRLRLGWQPDMAPIFQACVAMDAQRRQHGLRLLEELEGRARAAGRIALQANCAIGVDANEFWRIAGFKPICHMTPATKTGRHVICWRKPLTRDLPDWFHLPPRRAGHMARIPTSDREAVRRPQDQAFAERFITGK